MIFKDQAESLVAKWENLRDEDDLEGLAAITAVWLSREDNVPAYVFNALDQVLAYEYKTTARNVYEIVRYLRSLSAETPARRATAPMILLP
jgi:hypothetical protein